VDKSTIIDLAKNEVSKFDSFLFTPEARNFKSFFSERIPPRMDDLTSAITYYESLSDDDIEVRYCIHHWEECALNDFDTLHHYAIRNFHRSINRRELARREIINVDLLLNDGIFQMIPNKENILIKEIPAMYEKFITGTWSNFFVAEELEAFENSYEERYERHQKQIAEHHLKYKESTIESLGIIIEILLNQKDTKSIYLDYMNIDWVTAVQIQALIWYKEAIEKIMTTGKFFLMA
jgi:hypothetical protein